MLRKLLLLMIFSLALLSAPPAPALDTVTAALTSKAFQYIPLVIAQERGYMKEEGLDLKLVFMQNAAGLQALIANQVQFSGSGSSALVAISKGNAPLKTVLAFNDQVLQWLVARPNIKSLRDLNGKKVATTGVASIAAYMPDPILTDLPLVADQPVDIGVEDFCKICRKCANTCPTNSIPFGDKVVFNGIEKYKINWLTCYKLRPYVHDRAARAIYCDVSLLQRRKNSGRSSSRAGERRVRFTLLRKPQRVCQ